ncbi:SHOCT-like domain-containing protein [Staphylococcus intermedius]|uniref:YvlB/LiaX N-terminal domain-containing protein n=1 Tax=Staphylococcus intermedius NCTC 11048 TaxID=1141106 RepID=A0A380GAV5_STAIN|nr:hypothetical protein [Staphylococcus intermedius]PCF65440.1 hypothetical protein B5C04_05150 [Staphylococcus intermedius]PCF81118.1 hypothetical protein B4W74_05500 [Staphylococcus intermedius]PCF82400.1 hypothetical protein B4W70_05145 [Staphylococcus intermedius]PCF87101.1 hypothetical protein B4W75_08415 [Staphylococcus intermedius]PCF87659.1 hypothetical protein B4W76_04540 [Staphylococcus intermedius]
MEEAKVKVLELLKDGKISVDEATTLLDAMTNEEKVGHAAKEDKSERSEKTARDFEETVEGFVNSALDSVASLLKQGQKFINVNRDKVKEMSESERQAALKKVEETLNEVRAKMKKD